MKNLKNEIKSVSGITLVALVVTISIILILTSISSGIFINGGIIEKAKLASNKYKEATNNEIQLLTELYSSIKIASGEDANITISLEDLDTIINEKVRKAMEGATTVPTGNIISQMGKTAPIGYLICDGAEYEISDYPLLASYFKEQFGSEQYFGGTETKFKVPDLKGEFLRGAGTNSRDGAGNGADVGIHQSPTQNPNLTGSVNGNFHRAAGNIGVSYADAYVGSLTTTWNYYGRGGTYASGNNNASRFYYISRPTNTAVLYCIKY